MYIFDIHIPYTSRQRRVFLDYASTTPLDPEVFKKMKPFMLSAFHNASTLYVEGVNARKAIEEARTSIARNLGVRSEEIIFTSGGTESINSALQGVYHYVRAHHKAFFLNRLPHIITSTIEHPAVLETCRFLEKEGAAVTYVAPRDDGRVHPLDVAQALRDETILVSIMHVNNEIGTIQPVRDISRSITTWKTKNGRAHDEYPFFHVDASQSVQTCDVRKETLGVDMMTLDASKFYGPKGVGILFKKHSIALTPLMYGGSQEHTLRPGTENVSAIVGCACALQKAIDMRDKETARLKDLQAYTLKLLENMSLTVKSENDQENIKSKKLVYTINGSMEYRVPHNINICIPNLHAEFAVIQLDVKGIACSSVTACRSRDEEPISHVISALNPDCARSSLRITFGRSTSRSDIRFFIKTLKEIIEKQNI